jgi:hypothetical protein
MMSEQRRFFTIPRLISHAAMYDASHQWRSALPNSLLGEQTLRRIMIAVAMGLAALGSQARAGIVVDISQVGANVMASWSGSVDLTTLNGVGNGGYQPLVNAGVGWVFVGPESGGGAWGGLTGPSSFGTGPFVAASSASGDSFGFEASNSGFSEPVFYLPSEYASGTALSGTATYDNTTIAALGLTPGTYAWTWGAGGGADSLTVNIAGVPEPSSLAMAATAMGLLGGLGAYRRRRSKV